MNAEIEIHPDWQGLSPDILAQFRPQFLKYGSEEHFYRQRQGQDYTFAEHTAFLFKAYMPGEVLKVKELERRTVEQGPKYEAEQNYVPFRVVKD